MVDVALRAAAELDDEASVEVLDLRTVWPIDGDAILESIGRTSRLCVLQEASSSLGAAGEVLSLVAREGFELLDAPPLLIAAPNLARAVRARARGCLHPVARARRLGVAEARWILSP